MKKKVVYIGLSADILHEGHINILKISAKLGDVTVGLLTDKAISTYKKFPHFKYKQRAIILKGLKYVNNIIPQDTLDYTKNLKIVKPDFLVHGDDWKKGIQKKTREKALKALKNWGGKLIEPKYTKNVSSSLIKKKIAEIGTTPDIRRSKLKRLMHAKDLVRIMESHNALTGLIIEKLNITQNEKYFEFDGLWSSSLIDSVVRGKPDNQSVDYSTRILGLNEILDVTTKPLIFDADNGGRIEHLPYLIKSLDRAGISAIVLEDKIGLKKNSLFKDQSGVKQDSVKKFCTKISKSCNSKVSDDLMIVARVESLILGKGLKDALRRAEAYSEAGADAILIHSKEKTPNEIFSFANKFIKSKFNKPMISVPSTYSRTKESDLIKNGFKIVIYANHFLRASYPAMLNTAKNILKYQRSFEAEKSISSIKEILKLI
jgi:phosphoenolpyruvate phosphomutase|tara:strand:- start:2348 stop:3640 length:1293 start_codon:yes stop_codon:yes gene_type:complete